MVQDYTVANLSIASRSFVNIRQLGFRMFVLNHGCPEVLNAGSIDLSGAIDYPIFELKIVLFRVADTGNRFFAIQFKRIEDVLIKPSSARRIVVVQIPGAVETDFQPSAGQLGDAKRTYLQAADERRGGGRHISRSKVTYVEPLPVLERVQKQCGCFSNRKGVVSDVNIGLSDLVRRTVRAIEYDLVESMDTRRIELP